MMTLSNSDADHPFSSCLFTIILPWPQPHSLHHYNPHYKGCVSLLLSHTHLGNMNMNVLVDSKNVVKISLFMLHWTTNTRTGIISIISNEFPESYCYYGKCFKIQWHTCSVCYFSHYGIMNVNTQHQLTLMKGHVCHIPLAETLIMLNTLVMWSGNKSQTEVTVCWERKHKRKKESERAGELTTIYWHNNWTGVCVCENLVHFVYSVISTFQFESVSVYPTLNIPSQNTPTITYPRNWSYQLSVSGLSHC